MRKLLSAGFARLFKSRIFWLGIAAAAVLSFAEFLLQNYRFSSELFLSRHKIFSVSAFVWGDILKMPSPNNPLLGSGIPLEYCFFRFSMFCSFFCAVFCCLFFGKKFSEHTVRNEIAVGHTSKAIYLSNLIVCTAAGWLMWLSYMLVQLCVGVPVNGSFTTSPGWILLRLLCTLLLIASFTSVFTMITALVQNRAAAVIICILFVLLFAAAGEALCSQMKEPEWIVITWQSINFEYQPITRPNPQYIGGAARVVIRVLRNFLPGAQAVNIASLDLQDPGITALCAAANVVLVTWIGAVLFHRRNLT